MQSFILKESVLNDDTLIVSDKGKIFKCGYVAIIEYWTFQNEWSNKKHIKRFRSKQSLMAFINKNYKDLEFDYLDFTDTSIN
jgi:hypothetical protein